VSLAFCARHVPCFVVLASLEGEVRKKPSSRLVRMTDNRYQKREELFKEPSSWSSAWEGGALGSLGSGSQLPLLSRVLTLRLGVLLSDFLCSSSESMEQTRWRSIGTSSRWSWEEAGREAYKWRRYWRRSNSDGLSESVHGAGGEEARIAIGTFHLRFRPHRPWQTLPTPRISNTPRACVDYSRVINLWSYPC
jgi:hypothetical protein